ncbi:hypothetical protein E6P09_16530 (plasmid) [Haloferax mediterranei ATCC 33500]|uniref:Uncharacterized protein n=1 Tax=Haloferax mediterranei (strain ATCC 33500 / DSM 1411 / JCM 8866 / NBRC 14739 / NCIMB 2177 / R-4) TaxID=523841 RepID=I3RAY8_HALMT|nr:hypothetical protein [Haloferax mediterranei]AFK21398.1 hypothetical protein HFX_6275 [Haloferax mediterranei ATCC 33500]AHZ24529.1 hypothetical protein BM92_16610 [Haloferax mediterranei ATCC 33500]ELZ97281.1 hypothetical protein C439_18203 [Haloferax mediterranei ATCC 33500]MDX5990417.1 hypothetical protein [Haloferax mediterranei ATCC 33500]QCQ76925.1 hypothetical protein E6P09_16530 [Haloferax mediterranei ATCC 33500]
MIRPSTLRRFGLGVFLASLLAIVADPAAASNAAVGLAGASQDNLSVPRWLYLATGGATVGASALLASFVTDRRFIERVHRWRTTTEFSDSLVRALRAAGGLLGIALLALVVYLGYTGPQVPTVSFAIIVVFAGLRAGYTMFSYLVADTWRALNPWRTVAAAVPNGFVTYPDRLGRWPAVAGILALVWVETATSVTSRPEILATALVGYTIVTLVGAVLVGEETWFDRVDPVSVFFHFYGRVAPIRLDDDGLSVRLPGMRLVTDDDFVDLADVAVTVVLVWELTFSGFVTTEQGAAGIRAAVNVGLPPLLVYALLYLGGFGVFLGLYVLAARITARRIDTFETPLSLAIRFAPPLLVIAAGYHLAHYFGFLISLSPMLVEALSSPLSSPANPIVLTLPAWFGGLNIVFILFGHLFAVWVAHSQAYRTFPSRMQAVRSQFPFVTVMILYTIISLWLISLPTASPPFLQ